MGSHARQPRSVRPLHSYPANSPVAFPRSTPYRLHITKARLLQWNWLSMRNLKRDRCTVEPALTGLEHQFAPNTLPLQCCRYSQLTDEASVQQRPCGRDPCANPTAEIIAVLTTNSAHEPN
jgi:hypothetical protein